MAILSYGVDEAPELVMIVYDVASARLQMRLRVEHGEEAIQMELGDEEVEPEPDEIVRWAGTRTAELVSDPHSVSGGPGN
jgi:hypothetical protein